MAVIMSKQIVLPNRTKFVNYIQSAEGQYINTKVNAKNTIRVVATFAWLGSSGASSALIGARANGAGIIFYNEISKNNAYYVMFGGSYPATGVGAEVGSTVVVDYDGPSKTVTVNGTPSSLGSATFSLSIPLFLFAINDNGTPSLTGPRRLYSCQIYDNGVLVRDFAPCYDKNGVACLYDKVSDEFYYNAGTGEFGAG